MYYDGIRMIKELRPETQGCTKTIGNARNPGDTGWGKEPQEHPLMPRTPGIPTRAKTGQNDPDSNSVIEMCARRLYGCIYFQYDTFSPVLERVVAEEENGKGHFQELETAH